MNDKKFWAAYRDPRWQKRRLEVLDRADWTCESCEATDKELQVHHRYYERGKKPWEYPDEALQCLCDPCHDRVTEVNRGIKEKLRLLSDGELERVLGYLNGLWCQCGSEKDEREFKVKGAEELMGVADSLGPWIVSEESVGGMISFEDTLWTTDLEMVRSGSLRRSWALQRRAQA